MKPCWVFPSRGPTTALFERLASGEADALILATSNHPAFRRNVLETAREQDFVLANAIHPTAAFDENVRIGGGNFIGAFCYFGAETVIGSNCYLSSRTTFEHHNQVGDGVTTGPNVATSGHVTVGDDVRFGTGVYVEPGLCIGAGATVASGEILTNNLDAGKTVKSRKIARTE